MKLYSLRLFSILITLSFLCSSFVGDDLNKIFVSKTMDVPASTLWKIVATDFDAIENSHCKIVKAEYVGNIKECKLGAKRRVDFDKDKDGRYLVEEIVNIKEDEMTLLLSTIEVQDLPIEPETTKSYFKIEDLGDGKSKISCAMQYTTSPAFLGSMMKGKMKRSMINYFIAVEHYAKTGESVNRANFDRIKKLY